MRLIQTMYQMFLMLFSTYQLKAECANGHKSPHTISIHTHTHTLPLTLACATLGQKVSFAPVHTPILHSLHLLMFTPVPPCTTTLPPLLTHQWKVTMQKKVKMVMEYEIYGDSLDSTTEILVDIANNSACQWKGCRRQ